MQGGEEALQQQLDDSLEDAAAVRVELEAVHREGAHKEALFQETLDSMHDRLDQFQEARPILDYLHHHHPIIPLHAPIPHLSMCTVTVCPPVTWLPPCPAL